MVDPAHIGREFPPFSYEAERGKVREFLLALGEDERAANLSGDPALPPTFPTVFTFWGGRGMDEGPLKAIGVEIWNVLHAEQEYQYLSPIHIGDTITGRTRIGNIYTKGGRAGQLEFVEMVTDYTNQRDEPVLQEVVTIIVRGQGGGA